MKRLAFALLLPVSACASMEKATVVNYDDNSVTISSLSGTESNDPKVLAEAQRVCGLTGKRAEFLGAHKGSTTNSTMTYAMGVPVYQNEFEFACL